jgi:predicted membrane-bound spermidine synthase
MAVTKPQHAEVNGKKFLPYYVISFLEGSAVMACELVGAKMIAPYYGNSLYVWTSVLATTLLGLTAGYYVGGMISKKQDIHKTLTMILALSAILLAAMPLISSFIMNATLDMSIQLGSLISCIVFIFPVLMSFGMVSPIIIRIVSVDVKDVGKRAGTVYTISTVGGIIMTFAMGFYFIPYSGLKMSSYLTAAVMALATILTFIATKPVYEKSSI